MTETPGFSYSLYFGIGVWDSRDTFKQLKGLSQKDYRQPMYG